MHHDFFAWVRLLLLIILILAFALWGTITESRFRMEQPEPEDPVRKEPVYIAQAIPRTTTPTEAETAPVPTLRHPPRRNHTGHRTGAQPHRADHGDMGKPRHL